MDTEFETDVEAAQRELRDRLIAAGRLVPTSSEGLYGRDEKFESIVRAVREIISEHAAIDSPTRMEYPPIIPAVDFDRIGYLRSFPNLAGVAYTFRGADREFRELVRRLDEGESVAEALVPAGVTLVPACCYPVYPSVSGTVPLDGRCFELCQYCYRNEPSIDPMRMVAFRQHEHVRIGTPEQVTTWRATWIERAATIFEMLGLDATPDVANDPFFGRAGRLMARTQRDQELKIEFQVAVHGVEHPTACASMNYHQDHFGHTFGIRDAEGEIAHSACVGFGLERITIALLHRFGYDPDDWRAKIRQRLSS